MATQFPSARHQAALGVPTGYRRFTRCTFSRGGVSLDLEPISGSFTQDARRTGRWDGRLTFAGDAYLPRRPGDLLSPFGTIVEVELGLELLDGSVSTVPYGTYEVASAKTRTALAPLAAAWSSCTPPGTPARLTPGVAAFADRGERSNAPRRSAATTASGCAPARIT